MKLDPRIIRTRRLIDDAFEALYRTKRVKDITVNDITATAGINRATFYKHYQDKFDLFDSYLEARFTTLLQRHIEEDALLDEDTFYSLIYASILFVCEWHGERYSVPEQSDIIVETRVQHVIFEKIMDWIEPNYRKGPCQVGTEVSATAVSWAIFGVARRVAEQNASVPIDDVSAELVRMLSGGLWHTLYSYHMQART